jgi:ABC-type Fe3+/spermidine/putrescine transport system ATPase subunit
MNNGRIEQLDLPTRIYDEPATRFVAAFVGKINFLEGRLEAADGGSPRVATRFGTFGARSANGAVPSQKVALAVRPEHLRLLQAGDREDGLNVVEGRIEAKTFVGNLLQVVVALDGVRLQVEERPGSVAAEPGDVVRVGCRPESCIVLPDAEAERRIA